MDQSEKKIEAIVNNEENELDRRGDALTPNDKKKCQNVDNEEMLRRIKKSKSLKIKFIIIAGACLFSFISCVVIAMTITYCRKSETSSSNASVSRSQNTSNVAVSVSSTQCQQRWRACLSALLPNPVENTSLQHNINILSAFIKDYPDSSEAVQAKRLLELNESRLKKE